MSLAGGFKRRLSESAIDEAAAPAEEYGPKHRRRRTESVDMGRNMGTNIGMLVNPLFHGNMQDHFEAALTPQSALFCVSPSTSSIQSAQPFHSAYATQSEPVPQSRQSHYLQSIQSLASAQSNNRWMQSHCSSLSRMNSSAQMPQSMSLLHMGSASVLHAERRRSLDDSILVHTSDPIACAITDRRRSLDAAMTMEPAFYAPPSHTQLQLERDCNSPLAASAADTPVSAFRDLYTCSSISPNMMMMDE
ncbi:hypothetical protein HDU78_003835 [Chytriomyces hyalinus]|nr:hypothetical protein HDU78_003835 [Chytriomyces hyalinus]